MGEPCKGPRSGTPGIRTAYVEHASARKCMQRQFILHSCFSAWYLGQLHPMISVSSICFMFDNLEPRAGLLTNVNLSEMQRQ